MTVRLIVVGLALAACGGLGACRRAADGPAQSKIILGPDTTVITGPLRPDGTPDYVAALNEKYARGVTPENNAAVVFVELFGVSMLPQNTGEKILRAMGARVTGGPLSRPASGQSSFSLAPDDPSLMGPWKEQDFPELAPRLEADRVPLDEVVAAAARRRWYFPAVGESKDPVLGSVLLPSFGVCRGAARALIARANLNAGEGRAGQARGDLLAACRLGTLLGQDSTLVGRLVAASVTRETALAISRVAACGCLSGEDARALLRDLQAVGPSPSMVESVDVSERWAMLDALVKFSRVRSVREFEKGLEAFTFITEGGMSPQARKKVARELPRTDWNDVLRWANRYYDDLVRAMDLPTFAERQQGYPLTTKRVRALASNMQRFLAGEPVLPETSWPGDAVLRFLLPDLGRFQTTADLAAVHRDLAVVSLALAAHRAGKGKYPEKLADLSPDYFKAVPDDFCSGKPFLYRSDGKTFLLYSVGENTKDDGGRTRDDDKDCDDIVVKTP